MIEIQRFIRSGGKLSDKELTGVMRDMFEELPVDQRQSWLQQVELSLDGYGGAPMLSAVSRVQDVLKVFHAELGASQS